MVNRVAEVNAALKAAGIVERLKAGRGYYYFYGGSCSTWKATAVYVFRSEELTVAQWLEEMLRLSKERIDA